MAVNGCSPSTLGIAVGLCMERKICGLVKQEMLSAHQNFLGCMNTLPCVLSGGPDSPQLLIVDRVSTAHTFCSQDACEGSCGEADPDLAASLSLLCYSHPPQHGDINDLCAVDDKVEASAEDMGIVIMDSSAS